MSRKIIYFIVMFLAFSGLFNIFYGKRTSKQGKVYFIKKIQDFGAVSSSYSAYLKKNLDIVNKDPNAKAVIIEIDTPGGAVLDAQKIATYIQNSKYKTISFINVSAYSAGAIISLAADYTVIKEGGKIGDAYPIMMGKEGPTSIKDKKVHAKIISGLTAMIRGLAERRKKRLIREIGEGVKRYDHLKGSNSVRNLKKIFAAMVDPSIKLTVEEDGYDLKSGDLLTLTTEEAHHLGVVDGIHNSLEDILTEFNLDGYQLVELEATTTDRLLTILTHPVAISILLSLGMLGMAMEFWTPGWGVPGSIGILALSLFFYAQIAGADASLSALVLFGLGVILIAIELFVIPGFGIVGAAGILSLFLSIVSALGVDFLDLENTADNLSKALVILVISLSFTVVSIFIIAKYLPKVNRFAKLSLVDSKILATAHDHSYDQFADKEGMALTILRPSGVALIDGKRVDVITLGNFIGKDIKIKVIQTGEGKVVVTEL